MDLDKICRLCSSRKSHLRSIFNDGEHNLVPIITQILQLKIYRNDGLPQNVCASCVNNLCGLRDSINKFREHDKALRRSFFGPGGDVHPLPIEIQLVELDSKLVLKQEENGQQGPMSNAANDQHAIEKSLKESLLEGLLDLNRTQQNDHKCYICPRGGSMGSTNNLLEHLSHHTDLLPYKCAECKMEPVILKDVRSLNNHRKMHAQPLKCEYCEQRFSDYTAMLYHLKTFHLAQSSTALAGPIAQREAIYCEYCDETFHDRAKLDLHKSRAHGINPKPKKDWREQYSVTRGLGFEELYTCKMCGKNFSKMIKIKNHVKNHFKDIKCDRCDLMFVSESKLKTHYVVHTGVRQHKCDICGKEFLWKNNLTQHLKLHRDERNHACEFCGKLFTYREGMKSHIRNNHLRDSPYECVTCRDKFVDNASLARHVMAEHQPAAPAAAPQLVWGVPI